MIGDMLVIDAVVHGYDFRPENRNPNCPQASYDGMVDFLYRVGHTSVESGKPGYLMSRDEFTAGWTAEELAEIVFVESDVDVMYYHGVEIDGFFSGGASPYELGKALKRAYPGRVQLYAPVDPLRGPAELELMEQRIREDDIDGLKFYPTNGVIDPEISSSKLTLLNDRELVFPYLEKARELGMRRIAIHKAVPAGAGPRVLNHVDDVTTAAIAFPDMTFEVVHSGWAFLEDCALQLRSHGNIYATIESVSNMIVRKPRKFAEIIGTLMAHGGTDRILFATGVPSAHPQPIVEALRDFTMPEDLVEGWGFPELTDEIKAKLLGGNAARLHGLDPAEVKRRISTDGIAERRAAYLAEGERPWKLHRERLAA